MEIVIEMDAFIASLLYYLQKEGINEISTQSIDKVLDIVTEIVFKDNRNYKIIYNMKNLLKTKDVVLYNQMDDQDFKYLYDSKDELFLLTYTTKLDDEISDILSKLDLIYITNVDTKTKSKKLVKDK